MWKIKYVAVFAVALLAMSFAVNTVMASGDNNQYTNGEDGNYEENNQNPYDDETFPGEAEQPRSGVV
ncbi:MAG: hypothetical protein ACP5FL_09775 [Thermoplasmatota archaeon]